MPGYMPAAVHTLISISLAFIALGPAGGIAAWGAPPKAISYEDNLRDWQLGTVTNDWSQTEAFDLGKPLELNIIIEGVEISRRGYVLLRYSLDLPVDVHSGVDSSGDSHTGILQAAHEVDRLRISLNRFLPGTRATLTGWPPTKRSYYGVSMLIDAIFLKEEKERIGFHDGNTD